METHIHTHTHSHKKPEHICTLTKSVAVDQGLQEVVRRVEASTPTQGTRQVVASAKREDGDADSGWTSQGWGGWGWLGDITVCPMAFIDKGPTNPCEHKQTLGRQTLQS